MTGARPTIWHPQLPSEQLPAGVDRIEVRESARRVKTVSAHIEAKTLIVLMPAGLARADQLRLVSDLARRVATKTNRAAAPTDEGELLARANRLAARYLDPVRPKRRARQVIWSHRQVSRWGACWPAEATIRLSSRLASMPGWVIDYVLIHELAHLHELAHNSQFHELVSRYPPAERAKGYLQGWVDATQGLPVDLDSDDVDPQETPL